MIRIADRITDIDAQLAVSAIYPNSAIAGRRVYDIGHAVDGTYLGGVTVEDDGEMLTITTTDAKGTVTATETAGVENAAGRIAAIVHAIAYDGVTDEQLRDSRLSQLRYVGSVAANARERRAHLIIEARNAGATYKDLTEASGLSRAMLDRIINDRQY